MVSLSLSSPAKVNLVLRVLGRRRDGYHELLTLFHRIALADTLTLRKIPSGIRIQTNSTRVPTGPKNIVWKAFRLLQAGKPFRGGVAVSIHKRIPVAAGLGGGSSNAAAFLLGMNRLYRLGLSKRKLLAIGSALGADVNFFLTGVNQAVGRARGERLVAKPAAKRLWFVLIVMPRPLSTAKVYRSFAAHARQRGFLTRERQVDRLLLGRAASGEDQGRMKPLVNDLEPAAVRLYPAILKALQFFERSGVRLRLVSGSGPTVFGVVKNQREAERVRRELKGRIRFHRNILVTHTF
jgi:4-diphosphocytidyl-2-C-methyl-D-erythritol kinase